MESPMDIQNLKGKQRTAKIGRLLDVKDDRLLNRSSQQ
jgi:hypothetical protein